MKKPMYLGNRIHLIDGYDLGLPCRTGTYVIKEDNVTLVETGPSMSVSHVISGLEALEISLEDIKYIIVTHIHLDHAGGAGLLLQKCPNAKVIVHPKGARHLADPTRLILGTKAVYGDKFDELFNPVVPIPADRLISMDDEQTLQIGEQCLLTFFHTPGHADHHFSIYDPVSNGMFTGDTIGVRYDQIKEFEYFLPSTSPNQFKPNEMLSSLEKIVREINVERIYFGHFSMTSKVEEVYKQINHWLPIFVATGEDAINKGKGAEYVYETLLSQVTDDLSSRNIQKNHPVYPFIQVDLQICSQGIIDYLQKKLKSN